MSITVLNRALTLAAVFSTTVLRSPASDVVLHTRNAPGMSTSDTYRALGRALALAKVTKRKDVFHNSTNIEKSWKDATLFSLKLDADEETRDGKVETATAIEITCSTCYLKAKATAQLSVDGDFNVTAAFNNVTDLIGSELDDIKNATIEFVKDYAGNVTENIMTDGFAIDDFALPPIDVDFDLDMLPIPESRLSFKFDDLELYVSLNTVLSSAVTYTLNLYTSDSPIGLSIADDLWAGVVFTIDLILSAEAEIDISSGFHIKFDDGVTFDLAIFGKSISDNEIKGGRFEFLPVIIDGAGGVLKAALRMDAKAGFNLDSQTVVPGVEASAGVMVGIFATLAEFTTNITALPAGDDSGCVLRVEESYQLAVGAAAGATVGIGDFLWGPTPNTTIPVFDTTMAGACASTKATSTISTPSVEPRAADSSMTVLTLETLATYTGIQCVSSGLVNCPASLQSTRITSSTKYLTTTVPSGANATFPDSIISSVPSTVSFGTAAKDLFSSSGTPQSFIPSASSSNPSSPLGSISGVDKRIIIGVCAGVGGAILLAIMGCCFFFYRRKKYATVPYGSPFEIVAEPRMYSVGYDAKKNTVVKMRISHN